MLPVTMTCRYSWEAETKGFFFTDTMAEPTTGNAALALFLINNTKIILNRRTLGLGKYKEILLELHAKVNKKIGNKSCNFKRAN